MYATLLDHFKLSLSQIGGLTDRQIVELYFHPRNEQGGIEPQVPREVTFEAEMCEIDVLAAMLRLTPENVEQLKNKIKEKYGRTG